MVKEIGNQFQKAQSPIQDKTKEKYTKTQLIKLTKINHKEIRLKAVRSNQQVTYKGNPICLTDLSAETLKARREWKDTFKVLTGEKKIYNQNYSTWQGSHSKLIEK